MRWAFRKQSTSDFGIDAQVEKLDDSGNSTGRLVALQIKNGSSSNWSPLSDAALPIAA